MSTPNQSDTPNQDNSKSDQPFQIDIDKIYSDIIQEIDASRSFVNISKNQNILNQLSLKDLAGNVAKLSKALTIETTPQESRCHTFFRLIGFPVVSDQFGIYNPGYNISNVNIDKKIAIANKPIEGFNDLSVKRETYVNDLLKIFSDNTSIDASVLSLSSIHIRKFSATLEKVTDIFKVKINDQLNSIDLHGLVGNRDWGLLTQYIDANGKTPTKLSTQRLHIIAPFIVDARIDFSVQPAANKIAVPFQLSKDKLLIGENTYVKRPLLEKIIRDRFTTQDTSTLGTAFTSTQSYINTVTDITDKKTIQQMINDVYKLSDNTQAARYINIISAMVDELVKAQRNIKRLQNEYYWLPIPSTIGPEGGNSVRDIIISQSLTSDFITPSDQTLILQNLKVIADQINIEVANLNSIPDPGGYAFDTVNTLDDKTTEGLGNTPKQTLDSLNARRNHAMTLGGQYLRTIEIIMGEFSGLGLCDIIIIMGSLYLMDKNSLLGFLDNDSFIRAQTSNVISSSQTNPGIAQAMTAFAAAAIDLYNLMDTIYQDANQNNNQA